MNTPAHLLLGVAVCGHRDAPARNVGAVCGSLIPDATIIFMVFWQSWVVGRTEAQIYGQDYFSPGWQEVFSISNSIPLFAAVALIGVWRRWYWLTAAGLAALLHVLTDIPLHVDDGHAPFWPFSSWIYESRYSYWDTRHGAEFIAPMELILSCGLALWLWFRHRTWWAGLVLVMLVAVEAMFTVGMGWLHGF